MKLSRSYCPRLEVLEDRMTPTTLAFPIGQSGVLLSFAPESVHLQTPTCGTPPLLHSCPSPEYDPMDADTFVFRFYVDARDAFVAAGVSLEQLAQVPPGLVIAAAPAVRGRA